MGKRKWTDVSKYSKIISGMRSAECTRQELADSLTTMSASRIKLEWRR